MSVSMDKFRFFVKKELKSRFIDLLRHQSPSEFAEQLRTDFLPKPLIDAFSQLTLHDLDIYMDYVSKYQGKRSYLTDTRVNEMLAQIRVDHPHIYKIMAPAIKDCTRRLKQMSEESQRFYEFYLRECSEIDFDSDEALRQYFLLVLSRWTKLNEENKQEFAKFFPNIYGILTDNRLYLWTGFRAESASEEH